MRSMISANQRTITMFSNVVKSNFIKGVQHLYAIRRCITGSGITRVSMSIRHWNRTGRYMWLSGNEKTYRSAEVFGKRSTEPQNRSLFTTGWSDIQGVILLILALQWPNAVADITRPSAERTRSINGTDLLKAFGFRVTNLNWWTMHGAF